MFRKLRGGVHKWSKINLHLLLIDENFKSWPEQNDETMCIDLKCRPNSNTDCESMRRLTFEGTVCESGKVSLN